METPIKYTLIFEEDTPFQWLLHWDFWLAVVTLALAAATVWLALETRRLRQDAAASVKATVKMANAAKEAIVLSNRPRILIRNITTVGNHHQQSIDGTLQIFNSGNTVASVFAVSCILWAGESLPMVFPYDTSGGDKRNEPLFTLPPGIYTTYPFKLYGGLHHENYDVYIMGEISYQDELNNQRLTRFCRRYDKKTKRFIAVVDADYESVD